MSRSDPHWDDLGGSFGDSYSSEEMEHTDCPGERAGQTVPVDGHGGRAGRPLNHRRALTHWPAVVLSVLGSAGAVAAVGGFCALIYPILRELRAERVRGPDGTEEKMLSFWSILVLSVLVGCICCVLSWTLTYLDSQQTAMVSSSPSQTLAHIRDGSDRGFHLGYGVAVLNGIMASLTVVWSLT